MKLNRVLIVAGIIIGANCFAQESMIKPLDIGSKTSSFTYTDTKNTVNYSNSYGQSSNEVYYKFTLTQEMDVKISHCDSELSDTFVHLLNANGDLIDENDDDWDYGYCSNTMNSYLNMINLPAGTYYVVSEGYSLNGKITTTIQGISPMDVYSQDIGSKASSFTFTDTKNTVNSLNRYIGQPTNDVFYKFTLTRPMDVLISHCGSEMSDTYVHLLGESGNLIAENDDNWGAIRCGNPNNSYLYMSSLAAGTYYVVSEGFSLNGNITTNIQGIRTNISTSQNGGLDTSTEENYILTITPSVATTDASTLSTDQSLQTIQYFDGLGRSSQTVQRQITPERKDLVTTVAYDEVGRENLQWLPTPVLDNQGAFVNVNDIGNLARNVHADSHPFNETIFENSPLNRVTEQKGSGVAWNTHPSSVSYQANDNDIANYIVNIYNQLERSTNYSSGMLYKTEVTDEDGKTNAEYKDKLGQVIMKQSSTDIKTYYVYNDLGQLSYVIPPNAADLLGTGTYQNGDENTILKQYCYLYKYDERGNCTQKRLPGCDWIYMVYDIANRMVLSQDGNQYDLTHKTYKQWTITKYDVFGRVLYTGLINREITIAEKESIQNNVMIESKGSSNPFYDTGYTCIVASIPSTDIKPLTVNYYDTYNDFLSTLTTNIKTKLTYSTLDGYETPYISTPPSVDLGGFSAKGLLTGTRTYILDNSNLFNVSALYYNFKGQVLQSRVTNQLNGFDIVYNAYDFLGHVTKSLKKHNTDGQTSIDELYTYSYDHAGRSTITKYKLGANEITLVANTKYDELGRLEIKERHTTGTDQEKFEYNIRNWPTKITSGTFEENLFYNSVPQGISNTPCFNGNIALSTWTYKNGTYKYGYNYDNLNRLTATTYYDSYNQPNGWYTESFVYDKMGNITHLGRMGSSWPIDDLTLNYNGNQLKKVDDFWGSQGFYSVKEYNNKSNMDIEFTYDNNGNMTKDLDRDIVTIQYNVLNLPEIIQFKNGNQIINKYDAGGQKLGTEYFTYKPSLQTPIVVQDGTIYQWKPNEFDQDGTAYIGNFEFKTLNGNAAQTTLSRIYNNEGYVENLSNPDYYYYRKDHLGNNREVWLANTNTTVQRTQYYASGLPWASNIDDNPGLQERKYNGKEFVEMHGYDTYDYGARGYYAASGRFMSVDPLAEKYYSISPYAYCLNNPVKFIDPDGRLVVFASGVSDQFKKNYMTATQALTTHNSGGFIKTLEDSKTTYTITESSNLESSFNSKNNTLTWSSNAMLLTTNGTSLSPTTILNHELDHAAQKDQNPEQQKQDGNTKSTNFGNKEEERVITGSEQQTAKNLGEIKEGEVTRTDHGGTLYQTNSPTSTQIANTPTITAPKKEEKK